MQICNQETLTTFQFSQRSFLRHARIPHKHNITHVLVDDNISRFFHVRSLQICRFVYVADDTVTISPRVRTLKVYSMLNADHKRRALLNQPYVIPYHVVNQTLNLIIDYYSHKVIELNPIDWENTLSGIVYIFAYGELPSKFIDVTFTDYYRCRYWKYGSC